MADQHRLAAYDARADCATDLPMRRFALRVVSELARTSGARTALPALAALLKRFARTGDPCALRDLLAQMNQRNVSAEDMMDIYLPQVVIEIGSDWHDDQLDILQASMAFSRLQSLLRELGRAWASDQCAQTRDGRVLLTLPRGEQHTLGAMFAANQLRRQGVSVKVMLMPSSIELADIMARNRFHGVLVSVSNHCALADCAKLLQVFRACDPHRTPIVLGGGLVSQTFDANDFARIAAISGADHVTNDLANALHFCGIHQVSAAAE